MSRPRHQQTETKQRLILPQSDLTNKLQNHLGSLITISTATGTKIGDIVKTKRPKHDLTHSVVYEIPCGGCDKAYYGESGRGFKTSIKEHKYDLKWDDKRNVMVAHRTKEQHIPRWKNCIIIHQGVCVEGGEGGAVAAAYSYDPFILLDLSMWPNCPITHWPYWPYKFALVFLFLPIVPKGTLGN